MTRRHRQPPVLALWLLDRLGFARANAPLLGDLLEEFTSGRSALWFWRQTVVVIALGIARRIALHEPYCIAVALGFAAQLPVSLLLYRLGVPSPIHGLGWKIAALILVIFAISTLPSIARRLFGASSRDARRLLVQPAAPAARITLMGAAAIEPFGTLPLLYTLTCVLSSRAAFSSPVEVVTTELLWLGIGEAATGLAAASTRRLQCRRAQVDARKAAAERERETRAWPRFDHPQITLITSDGAAFHLELDTCLETIFASANHEMIDAIFSRGATREQLRRALLLAAAAYDLDASRSPIPLSRFTRLLGPGPENDRVMHYLELTPRVSLPRRLLARFLP